MWCEGQDQRETTLKSRNDAEVIGQELSMNGSHSDAAEPSEARIALSIPAGPT